MIRDPVTGQFAYDEDFDRMCRCGHTLGVHLAGGFDCINIERSAGGSGEACNCTRFTPTRKRAIRKSPPAGAA